MSRINRLPARRRLLGWEQLEDRSLLANVGLISFNSSNADSGNTGSTFSNMSSDGRYVVFQSAATDMVSGIPDVTGAGGDMYVRDRLTNQTELVTINRFGTKTANNSSFNPNISANGRYVLFESLASDLVPNDTNDAVDVFVRDLQANTTKLVSVNTTGGTTKATSTISDSPQTDGRFLSDDGRYVVFQSDANNLVAKDTNGSPDVFVRDIIAGTTKLVSINATGAASGNSRSDHAVISANGRYVAFDSLARNLTGTDDFVFQRRVFVRDLQTNKTILASTDSKGGGNVNDESFLPKISADGQVTVFESFAKLATNDTNTNRDVYVRDLGQAKPVLVSVNKSGTGANFSSFESVISDNGQVVAFESIASDLVANDLDGTDIESKDVFVRNLKTNITTLVSPSAAGGNSANRESRNPSISADGNIVAFESHATNLITGFKENNDTLFNVDVFMRNVSSGTTTLISHRLGSNVDSGNEGSHFPIVSRDGRYVSFHSVASDLVSKDTNDGVNQTDVFVSSNVFEATPKITLSGAATYTENNAATVLAATATVSDPDSANFNFGKLNVSIVSHVNANDRLAIRNQGTAAGQIGVSGANVTYGGAVIGTFTGGSGSTLFSVSLNAKATVAATQALVRNITFRTLGENPSTAARTINFRLSDGDGATSAIAAMTVAVVAKNDAPVLSAISSTLSYKRNTAAILVAPSAAAADPDSANFANGFLTVKITAGANAGNRLTIGGPFVVSGANIRLNGVTIGTKNTNGGVGTTNLAITFNSSATPAIVQQLVRATKFGTAGSNSNATRTLAFTLTDGDGGTSNTASVNVGVHN